MAPGAVDVWLSEVDTAASGTSDPALVRLGLAVTRGLLLDLVAADDDAGVTSTAQAFARPRPPGRSPTRRSRGHK
jgi:hypothetical protein